MSNTNSNAFGKVKHLVSTSLQQLTGINKPRIKFLTSLFEVWLSLPVRYTMLNLGRFGHYCEKSIRLHFERTFDFSGFNAEMIRQKCSKDLIAAFDPSYVPKSGKHTPGLGRWWSGKDQRTLKGLEIGCLSIVDVVAETAMSLKVIQTPCKSVLEKKGWSLVDHYVAIIKGEMEQLKRLVKYLAVDGYFMKHDFIKPVLATGLHIITKMRPDANLRYTYKGPKHVGRGRPRQYDGKVDLQQIDKRRIRQFTQDGRAVYYSGIVYAVTLKQLVRIVYIEDIQTGRYDILLSTDTMLDARLIVKYYRLRFQIEFLIRDAKQHAGLEECQARSENKLAFHFNMAFSAVSLAKATTCSNLPVEKRETFSMRNIKVVCYNKFLADRIFANLGLDLNCRKIRRLYHKCLNTGALAA